MTTARKVAIASTGGSVGHPPRSEGHARNHRGRNDCVGNRPRPTHVFDDQDRRRHCERKPEPNRVPSQHAGDSTARTALRRRLAAVGRRDVDANRGHRRRTNHSTARAAQNRRLYWANHLRGAAPNRCPCDLGHRSNRPAFGRLSTCLVRAVVAEALLSSPERPISLTIGVKRADDGSLRAHAWVANKDIVLMGATSEEYVRLVEWNGTSA